MDADLEDNTDDSVDAACRVPTFSAACGSGSGVEYGPMGPMEVIGPIERIK